MKTLGPKFGPRLKEVQSAVGAADAAALSKQIQAGAPFDLPCPNGAATLEPADLIVQLQAPEGWAGVDDHGTQVLIDTRITDALAAEGMAREVIRHVQELRKKTNLEMEDRIALHLHSDAEKLQKAIQAHQAYIAAETLATQWATTSLDGDAHPANVKVDGQALTIQLRRV